MAMIIALHAQPRAGKDTLAGEMIAQQCYVRFSFAGPLYKEVSEAFGAEVELLESDLWKRNPQNSLRLMNCTNPDFCEVATAQGIAVDEPLTSRRVLQLWGTEYRRYRQENYWTLKMWDALAEFFRVEDASRSPLDNYAVITDTRVYMREDGTPVYDEAEVLQRFAATMGIEYHLVEVVRDGTEDTGHSSDTRFLDSMIDTTIYNNSTPQAMLDQLNVYLESEALEQI